MAAAIGLREDYDAGALRAMAKRAKDGPQARRLLALAAIYDGATRSEAAKIGGVGLQVIRDWVVRFNAHGPDGLIDRKAPGQPPRLNDAHRAALAAMIESGPTPAIHGVVRWRIVDLCQWVFEEFRVAVSEQTMSRELRKMGYRKLSARPRHHAQAEGAIEDFKKTSRPPGGNRARKRRRSRRDRDLVRTMKPASARRTRSRAAGPSAARAPALLRISEPLRPISSARSAPRKARARRLVMPTCNT